MLSSLTITKTILYSQTIIKGNTDTNTNNTNNEKSSEKPSISTANIQNLDLIDFICVAMIINVKEKRK